jgi:glycosyltransferase involved in cell wall biosynthesis
MNQLKVAFFPYGSEINPYQKLLKEALENHSNGSLKIIKVPGRKWFPYFQSSLLGADFIHHFWPHDFYQGKNKYTAFLKQISFSISLLLLNRKKVIYSAENLVGHDFENFDFEIFWIQKIINYSKAIVFMSNASKDHFLKYYRVKSSCELIVLPHINYLSHYPNFTFKNDARLRLNIQNDSNVKVLLSLGRISAYKGTLELIECFVRISDRNSVLLLAGKCNDIRYLSSINELIKAAEKDGLKIIFNNQFISDDEVQYYFNASNGVVINYKDFPMNPGSIVMAMGFGCTIIAPSTGAIPEIVPKDSLFGFEPDNIASLESAIRLFLLNENVLEMGDFNKKIIELNHSPEIVAGRLKSLYGKLKENV